MTIGHILCCQEVFCNLLQQQHTLKYAQFNFTITFEALNLQNILNKLKRKFSFHTKAMFSKKTVEFNSNFRNSLPR